MMLPTKHLHKTALAVALSVSLFACGGVDDSTEESSPVVTTEQVNVVTGETFSVEDTTVTVAANTTITYVDANGNSVDVAAADAGAVDVTVAVATDNGDGLTNKDAVEAAIKAGEDAEDANTNFDSVVSVSGIVMIDGVKRTVTAFNPPVQVNVAFSDAAKLKAGCQAYSVLLGNVNIAALATSLGIRFDATQPGIFSIFEKLCPTSGEGSSN